MAFRVPGKEGVGLIDSPGRSTILAHGHFYQQKVTVWLIEIISCDAETTSAIKMLRTCGSCRSESGYGHGVVTIDLLHGSVGLELFTVWL